MTATTVAPDRLTFALLAAAIVVALLGAGPSGIALERPQPLIEISATTLTSEGQGPVTVAVSNPTASTARGVTAQVSHLFDTSAATSTADRGAYEPDTGTWLVGDLGPGEAATLTLHP